MADDVIFRFLDRGSIPGIYARDLTQRDFDRLSPLQQRDVRAGTLYEPVGTEPEQPPNSAPDVGPDIPRAVAFDGMTKAQLVDYATAHDIDLGDLDASSPKAELVAALKGGE